MKKVFLKFLQKRTEEYEEPRIPRQIKILFKKYRHHNYHNDFFRFGKFIIVLLAIFIAVFLLLKHFSDQKLISKEFSQTNF